MFKSAARGNGAERTDRYVRALQDVMVSTFARLHDKRAAENQAPKAIEAMQCA